MKTIRFITWLSAFSAMLLFQSVTWAVTLPSLTIQADPYYPYGDICNPGVGGLTLDFTYGETNTMGSSGFKDGNLSLKEGKTYSIKLDPDYIRFTTFTARGEYCGGLIWAPGGTCDRAKDIKWDTNVVTITLIKSGDQNFILNCTVTHH